MEEKSNNPKFLKKSKIYTSPTLGLVCDDIGINYTQKKLELS